MKFCNCFNALIFTCRKPLLMSGLFQVACDPISNFVKFSNNLNVLTQVIFPGTVLVMNVLCNLK